MLDAIRKRTGSIFVKVLLVFLVLSFGAWGVGDYIQGGAIQTTAVTVGEREISTYRVSNELQREVTRLRQLLGDTVTLESLRNMGLDRALINRLVQSELFSLAAESHGLMVPDDDVRVQISEMRAFHGLNGTFDPDIFRQIIASAGYSETGFIDIIRDETRQAMVLESLRAGAVLPRSALRRIHAYRNETRSAQFVRIPDSSFTRIDPPRETEIQAWHQDNQNLFMAPEYRDVTFIYLQAQDLTHGIEVNEQNIEASYADRESEFVTMARRNVDQGIFSSEEQAQQAVQRLDDGMDFARAVAATIDRDVDSLGWVIESDLFGTRIAEAVFNAGAGDVVGPVQSPLGWHLFNITGAEDEQRQSLEQVRQTLRDDLAMEHALDELFELANELEDLLGSGMSLEDAGETLGFAAKNIPDLSEGGVDRNGDRVTDIPHEGFLATVYATGEGFESPLVESGGDAYFIVRVNAVTAPVLRPLDSIKDRVITSLMAERRAAKGLETAESIAATLKTGDDLDLIARQYGGMVNASDAIRRDGTGLPDDVPPGMAPALFDVSTGETVVVRGNGEHVIGLLTAQTPAPEIAATDEAGSASLEALEAELNQGIQNDIIEQFSEALRRQYPISVNDQALRQAQGLN